MLPILTQNLNNSNCKNGRVHSESVAYWTLNLREMLADSLDVSDIKISGPNIILEADETRLGKRKFNRGRLIDVV